MLDCAASSRRPSCTACRRSRRTGTRSIMPRSFVKSRAGLRRRGRAAAWPRADGRPSSARGPKSQGAQSPAENLPPPAVACGSKFSAWLSCPLRAVGVCALVAFCARHSYAGALALERARGTVWEWRCPPLTHPAIGGRPLPFPGAAVADRHLSVRCRIGSGVVGGHRRHRFRASGVAYTGANRPPQTCPASR